MSIFILLVICISILSLCCSTCHVVYACSCIVCSFLVVVCILRVFCACVSLCRLFIRSLSIRFCRHLSYTSTCLPLPSCPSLSLSLVDQLQLCFRKRWPASSESVGWAPVEPTFRIGMRPLGFLGPNSKNGPLNGPRFSQFIKKWARGPIFDFWEAEIGALLRIRWAHCGEAGVVCVCVSCRGVSIDVFLRAVCHVFYSKKKHLWRQRKFGLRTHALPMFSNIPRPPVHVL